LYILTLGGAAACSTLSAALQSCVCYR